MVPLSVENLIAADGVGSQPGEPAPRLSGRIAPVLGAGCRTGSCATAGSPGEQAPANTPPRRAAVGARTDCGPCLSPSPVARLKLKFTDLAADTLRMEGKIKSMVGNNGPFVLTPRATCACSGR